MCTNQKLRDFATRRGISFVLDGSRAAPAEHRQSRGVRPPLLTASAVGQHHVEW